MLYQEFPGEFYPSYRLHIGWSHPLTYVYTTPRNVWVRYLKSVEPKGRKMLCFGDVVKIKSIP